MWKRKELKNKAKKIVKQNYWTAIVVCFLLALLTGEFGTSIIGIWKKDDSIDPYYVVHKVVDNFAEKQTIREKLDENQLKLLELVEANLNDITKPQKYIFKIWDAVASFNINLNKLGIALSVGAVISFAFTVLVADPIIVGGKKYFLNARKSNAKIGDVIDVFKKEYWLNVVRIMFLRNIYNALWYITIVGGIIKTYEYRMIPYIVAENPTIKQKEAFKLSKKMMKGNKWRTFILDMSFFGWYFLSVLTFGLVSILYVNPYNASTMAELYAVLKKENNI